MLFLVWMCFHESFPLYNINTPCTYIEKISLLKHFVVEILTVKKKKTCESKIYTAMINEETCT